MPTEESVNLASSFTELPVSSHEKVVDHFREESKHQAEIGEGQVHDQHVGWGPQGWEAAENFQYDEISADSSCSCLQAIQLIRPLVDSVEIEIVFPVQT